jgi:hypothetical protein
MSLLIAYPLWYCVTNTTNPSSTNKFRWFPLAMFLCWTLKISGVLAGCLPMMYIKINNCIRNSFTAPIYLSNYAMSARFVPSLYYSFNFSMSLPIYRCNYTSLSASILLCSSRKKLNCRLLLLASSWMLDYGIASMS